jgi:hypothetical protein
LNLKNNVLVMFLSLDKEVSDPLTLLLIRSIHVDLSFELLFSLLNQVQAFMHMGYLSMGANHRPTHHSPKSIATVQSAQILQPIGLLLSRATEPETHIIFLVHAAMDASLYSHPYHGLSNSFSPPRMHSILFPAFVFLPFFSCVSSLCCC